MLTLSLSPVSQNRQGVAKMTAAADSPVSDSGIDAGNLADEKKK